MFRHSGANSDIIALYSPPKSPRSVEFSSESLEEVPFRDILDLGLFFPHKMSMKKTFVGENSSEEKSHWMSVGYVLPQVILTSLGFAVKNIFLQSQLQN